MKVGVLGPFVFEVSADAVRTWQEIKRSTTARWVTHDVFAGKPKKEFIGPGLAKMTLTVRLDSQFGIDPSADIAEMRKQSDAGAVLQFTLGGAAKSELVGNFSIEDLAERWLRTSGDGKILAALLDITLEEYQ